MPGRRTSLVDEVRDAILTEIGEGKFSVGDQLPNEQDMGQRFEVSRATIREAYRSLISAGYLRSRQGSGTYVVRSPHQRSLDSSLSYMAMITAAGLKPGIRMVGREEREADAAEAERLHLDVGAPILSVDRIHLANDHPVIFSRDRIPAEHLRSDVVGELTGSLFSLMESLGREPRSGRALLTPVLADQELATHLRVTPGSALLHIDEVDLDARGAAVLYSEEWHIGGVFPLWLNRRVTLQNDPY